MPWLSQWPDKSSECSEENSKQYSFPRCFIHKIPLIMKKFAILLLAVIASVTGAAAMNLRDAFGALSNIQNVQTVVPDYNMPVTFAGINDAQIAAAYNLDAQNIFATGNAAYAILNQVPLAYQINGGNNNQVAAFVYATPNAEGTNDVLIAVMSGFRGSVVFIYGTAQNDVVDAIKAAPFQMEGSFLSLNAPLPDDNEFNIYLTKGR